MHDEHLLSYFGFRPGPNAKAASAKLRQYFSTKLARRPSSAVHDPNSAEGQRMRVTEREFIEGVVKVRELEKNGKDGR